MRLLSPWAVALLLLALTGCIDDIENSSATAPPDNQAPDDNDSGSGDNGSGDSGDGDSGSGDSGSGDSGSGDSGDGDSGDGDCGYTDPLEITPAITLGNTNDIETYQLKHFHERTELTDDLTGTWVMMHRDSQKQISNEIQTTTDVWQKSVFIIRNHSDKLEVARCSYGGFTELTINDDQITLPLFGEYSNAPTFQVVEGQYSSLSVANQLTHAIKVSAETSSFGKSTISIDGREDTNADVWCVTQKREIETKQACSETAQQPTITLSLILGTSNDSSIPSNNRHAIAYTYDVVNGSSTTLSHYAHDDEDSSFSRNTTLLLPSTPSVLDITTSHSQITVQVDLTDGVIIPSNELSSGSLTLNLTLPGAVIP